MLDPPHVTNYELLDLLMLGCVVLFSDVLCCVAVCLCFCFHPILPNLQPTEHPGPPLGCSLVSPYSPMGPLAALIATTAKNHNWLGPVWASWATLLTSWEGVCTVSAKLCVCCGCGVQHLEFANYIMFDIVC